MRLQPPLPIHFPAQFNGELKDKYQNKATYISKLGLDGAVKKNKRLVEEACEALSLFGEKAENLRQISHFIINRKN